MTLAQCYQQVAFALRQAGFENPLQEAKWLITSALDKETSFLLLQPHYHLSPAEEEKLEEWKTRRLKGEPLSRLKGIREFWSLSFHLNAHTLDPRPETETLIEGALGWFRRESPLRILDLGTGTGCLLIALLKEYPMAHGVGIDLSQEALEMAKMNAKIHELDACVQFAQGNWGKDLEGPFDLIISNPPYIPLTEKDNLNRNVISFDPALALFGGEDGLEAYRILRHDIKRLLAPEGLAILEMGYGKRPAIEALFHDLYLETAFIRQDLSGIERTLGLIHRPL